MAEYSITFARSARRELEALDSSIILRILSKIETLAVHPRPPGSRKLSGEKHLWRIRPQLVLTGGWLAVIAIALVWFTERAFDLKLFPV